MATEMVTPTGTVNVSDFGLACRPAERPRHQSATCVTCVPGSARPGYIESVVGVIYAMGVTLYRLLNGDSFLGAAQTATLASFKAMSPQVPSFFVPQPSS